MRLFHLFSPDLPAVSISPIFGYCSAPQFESCNFSLNVCSSCDSSCIKCILSPFHDTYSWYGNRCQKPKLFLFMDHSRCEGYRNCNIWLLQTFYMVFTSIIWWFQRNNINFSLFIFEQKSINKHLFSIFS